MQKFTIAISALFFGLGLLFIFQTRSASAPTGEWGTVSVENGVQTVSLLAKGGYFPQSIRLAANMETLLEVHTQNTYDCSASLLIPDLSFATSLPQNGTTEVKIPAQKSGTVLQGTCGMGMYGFTLIFD